MTTWRRDRRTRNNDELAFCIRNSLHLHNPIQARGRGDGSLTWTVEERKRRRRRSRGHHVPVALGTVGLGDVEDTFIRFN
ncbi:hypothetical protein TGAMA5MH_08330 [Trichoderma gamsii]|uniref:Uncharacterized protein n=1 Tax=Trichoderma gamsii TaxID=398673 RepID=A0A2K0T2S8_9HYPO|nr:hypothetical protein TGAMA5MH_08330 [Trichoderma gamsii]